MQQTLLSPTSERPIAVLVPRLRVGGADSYIRDALACYPRSEGQPKLLLYVIHPTRGMIVPQHNVEVIPVGYSRSMQDRLTRVVRHMLERGVTLALVQLLSLPLLRLLWAAKVQTAIIFQNEEQTWSYSPRELRSSDVPFLIAPFRAMADRLHALAPTIQIRTVPPMPDVVSQPGKQPNAKRYWDVPEDAVVLGMIGTFKLHKRYTLAVRILRCLRDRGISAFLCIAGGHTEKYGGGQQAYSATYSLAKRLEVAEYLRCPGEILQAEELYASFDLFLNTSLYEGLSRATLSAATHGCPVVATAVGGHEEVLSPPNRSIPADASPENFAEAALAGLASGWQPATCLAAQRTSQAAWSDLWRQLQQSYKRSQLLPKVS